MMSGLFLAFYLSLLVLFAFVTNPVVCCFILLACALTSGVSVYLTMGFSWYLVLFYVVYVGGVYVLYMFVSVQSPNVSSRGAITSSMMSVFFLFFLMIFMYLHSNIGLVEVSYYLVSEWENLGYTYFCCVLLMGLFLVSLVGSKKSSFHR